MPSTRSAPADAASTVTRVAKETVEDVLEMVGGVVEDVERYLASPEGRDMRRKVATALVAAAPIISRARFMRASPLGRIVGLAGGAAVIVRVADTIRDWEPNGSAR